MPAAAARVAVGAYWGGLTLGHVVSGAIAHRVAPARVLRRDAARHGGAADLSGRVDSPLDLVVGWFAGRCPLP